MGDGRQRGPGWGGGCLLLAEGSITCVRVGVRHGRAPSGVGHCAGAGGDISFLPPTIPTSPLGECVPVEPGVWWGPWGGAGPVGQGAQVAERQALLPGSALASPQTVAPRTEGPFPAPPRGTCCSAGGRRSPPEGAAACQGTSAAAPTPWWRLILLKASLGAPGPDGAPAGRTGSGADPGASPGAKLPVLPSRQTGGPRGRGRGSRSTHRVPGAPPRPRGHAPLQAGGGRAGPGARAGGRRGSWPGKRAGAGIPRRRAVSAAPPGPARPRGPSRRGPPPPSALRALLPASPRAGGGRGRAGPRQRAHCPRPPLRLAGGAAAGGMKLGARGPGSGAAVEPGAARV